MIYIVLKNRKVLHYNKAENTSYFEGIIKILDSEGKWIAQIPIDNIERIEAIKPCRILEAKLPPKLASY